MSWLNRITVMCAVMFMCMLVFASCSDDVGDGVTQNPVEGAVESIEVYLDDGRTVSCVIYDGFRAGGISCDWATAG